MEDKKTVKDLVLEHLSMVPSEKLGDLARAINRSESAVQKVVSALEGEKIHSGIYIDLEHLETQKYLIFIETQIIRGNSRKSISDILDNKETDDFYTLKQENNQFITYQHVLFNDIKKFVRLSFPNKTLFIQSCDMVMGADFDMVLTIHAKEEKDIARFVKMALRRDRRVKSTRTNKVWTTIGPDRE